MKLTRNLPMLPPQRPSSDAALAAAQQTTAQTTQRVAAYEAAAEAMGGEAALTADQDSDLVAPPQGRLRRKAQQWLGKLGHRAVLAPGRNVPAAQHPPRDNKSIRAAAFELPAPSGPTLQQQALASAIACAARVKSGQPEAVGASKYLDAHLVAQLLRRDTPKTETFEQLSAAPVERALDSILVDEIIRHMPAHLIAPIAALGRASADLLDQADPQRRVIWVRGLCDALKLEYPRPWGVKTPITDLLCVGAETVEDKADALLAFLRQTPNDGYETMAAMAIMRAMYQSAERQGFASQTVPFISRSNNFYICNMLDQTGRIYVKWGAEKPKHQGVGLTAFGAPSPVDASWMQPATISSHLYEPNPACNTVARDLAYGNPYGVGISGSTNIFLFAAGAFNALGTTHIDMMDLTTSMATMLCYNGGHSFAEVYNAAQMYPEAASTSLVALESYHPGQARGLFIHQVDPGNSWLAEAGFKRLAAFLIELDKTANP